MLVSFRHGNPACAQVLWTLWEPSEKAKYGTLLQKVDFHLSAIRDSNVF